MARDDPLRRELAALTALQHNPAEPEAIAALGRALGSRSNIVVGRAADIAGEAGLNELEPAMTAAFDRFMVDAVRSDPTCAAKFAIAGALARVESRADDLFLRGIRHVQLEPVYGGVEDTAAKLRAACAAGLAGSGSPEALLELARLLADKEPDARIGAARALARIAQPGALPLLWFKALTGDSETSVMLECFLSLLALAPEQALTFVAGYLSSVNEPVAEAAALSLGESRRADAFAPLDAALVASPEPSLRRMILLAMAMLRSDVAIERLLVLVERGNSWELRDALAALAMYRDDELLWERVEARRSMRKG